MATSILEGIVQGSSRIPDDRFLEDQADTGEFHIRRISRRRHWQFNLVWKNRQLEDVDAVENFWASTYEQAFDYTWPLDKKIYIAHFMQAPVSKPQVGILWEIHVTLLGRIKP